MENVNYPAFDSEREWFEMVEAERAQEWEREMREAMSPLDDDLCDCDEPFNWGDSVDRLYQGELANGNLKSYNRGLW